MPTLRTSRAGSAWARQRPAGPHMEIHPNKSVEPLDADLCETRVFSEVPEKRSPLNGGTPLPRTRILGERPRTAAPAPRRSTPRRRGRIGFRLGRAGGADSAPGRLERPSRRPWRAMTPGATPVQDALVGGVGSFLARDGATCWHKPGRTCGATCAATGAPERPLLGVPDLGGGLFSGAR